MTDSLVSNSKCYWNGEQGLKFGFFKYRKNLKISVFGGAMEYLEIFVFVTQRLETHLFFLLFANRHFWTIWEYLDLLYLIKINHYDNNLSEIGDRVANLG